jgi:hypothetical protein
MGPRVKMPCVGFNLGSFFASLNLNLGSFRIFRVLCGLLGLPRWLQVFAGGAPEPLWRGRLAQCHLVFCCGLSFERVCDLYEDPSPLVGRAGRGGFRFETASRLRLPFPGLGKN